MLESVMAGDSVSANDIALAMAALKVEDAKHMIVFSSNIPGSISPAVACHFLKEVGAAQSELTHVVDVIHDHAGEFDWDNLQNLLERPAPLYDQLPAPLKPKAVMPHETIMQICIYEHQANPKHYTILKWFTFMRDGKTAKTSKEVAIILCNNTPMMINMGGGGRVAPMHFHYLLENMGMWQARTKSLAPKMQHAKDAGHTKFMMHLTDDEVDEGFDFIVSAPTEALLRMKWIAKAIKNDTPVHGWPSGLIEKALANIAADWVPDEEALFLPI